MKITRINKLQKCGIFHDFKWGKLPEFARFNLVYGHNGSGKTTLSRILRDLELGRIPEGKATISTDESGNIRGDDFPKGGVPIRVFNSDFVKDNVFSVEGKDIPPIIVLGQASKEKQDMLAKKRNELVDAKKVHDGKRTECVKAEKNLDQYCKTRSQFIKSMLEGTGEDNNYGNYNKTKYRVLADELLDKCDMATHLLDDESEKELLGMHRATPKPEIPEPVYPTLDLAALQEKVADQLSRTVTSKAIGSLRDDPGRAEWVRRGMGLRDAKAHACPFCEQQVPDHRELELRHHFSSEHEDMMRALDELAAEIDGIRESCLSKLVTPDCEMIHDHLLDKYEKARIALGDYRSQVKKYLDSLADAISRKRRRPFDPVPLDVASTPFDGGPPDVLAGIVREHNDVCRNLAGKASNARKRLESGYAAKDLAEFKQLRNNHAAATKEATKSESRVASLDGEVSALQREISNHSKPADDFNDGLSRYLGHGELRLAVRENGYMIVRDGSGDPLPSEGEKTAIALLYFLTSLKEDQFDIKKGVIVLDDPISSFDTNTLFAAYGLVRERTKSAEQLFILTHNFTFFREVREWFGSTNRKNQASPRAQFYMLGNASDSKNRHSEIRKLDPLLMNYESDYHYLFACVWRGAKSTDTLESYYPLPNMARRLLDAFLAFRRPDIPGTMGDRMNTIGFEERRKRRILAFVNAHSHNISIAEPKHDADLLAETPDVLSDIMDLMKQTDPGHYASMEKLVDQTPE